MILFTTDMWKAAHGQEQHDQILDRLTWCVSTKQISVFVPNIPTQRVNVYALAYDQHVEKPHMTRNNVHTQTWASKSYPTEGKKHRVQGVPAGANGRRALQTHCRDESQMRVLHFTLFGELKVIQPTTNLK